MDLQPGWLLEAVSNGTEKLENSLPDGILLQFDVYSCASLANRIEACGLPPMLEVEASQLQVSIEESRSQIRIFFFFFTAIEHIKNFKACLP